MLSAFEIINHAFLKQRRWEKMSSYTPRINGLCENLAVYDAPDEATRACIERIERGLYILPDVSDWRETDEGYLPPIRLSKRRIWKTDLPVERKQKKQIRREQARPSEIESGSLSRPRPTIPIISNQHEVSRGMGAIAMHAIQSTNHQMTICCSLCGITKIIPKYTSLFCEHPMDEIRAYQEMA